MPAKKASPGRSVALAPALLTVDRLIGNELVRVDAVYHVKEVALRSPGPWEGEADKIAWTDPLTGYGCIIRRSPQGRHLCGYVAVPPGHPFFGRDSGTLVGYEIGVHGGLDYSKECQARESESRSICHVNGRAVPPKIQKNVHENDFAKRGDDAWWFGFSCNHPSDLVPDNSVFRQTQADVENAATYKDEAFVYGECQRLSIQLKAVEVGVRPSEVDPGPTAPFHDLRRVRG